MSRRLENRLKCELPLLVRHVDGDAYVSGTVYDLSATHLRARFPTALSVHKRYQFQTALPDQRELQGALKIERSIHHHAGLYDYVFVIERLSAECESAIVDCISRQSQSTLGERRKAEDVADYRKNRRAVDRVGSRSSRPRVVITGIGVVSSNAIGRAAFWDAIQNHKSGIREITAFDTAMFPVKIAGQIRDEDLAGLIPKQKMRHMGRATKFGWLATKLALEDAEMDLEKANLDRFGVAMGSTLATLDWAFAQYAALKAEGPVGVHPYTVAAGSANAISGEIGVEYGFRGPSITFSQGCTSSSVAIAYGADQIQMGKVDVMVVGGADAPLNPTVFSAFVRSGLLSHTIPSWKGNVINREDCFGSVLGEGACVLVLESLDHAIQRGAPLCAEILSGSNASEGYHMVSPHPSGRGTARAIKEAFENAKIDKDAVDLIIGHLAGIGESYDIEMRVLRRIFGNRISLIPIANVKPLIGYTQGACGAFEVAAACLAFQSPTNWITYATPHEASKASVALINCIGFGGKNSTLILQKASLA